MFKALARIFANKKEQDLAKLHPYVEQINAEYEKLRKLSDDELRAKSDEFRARIQQHLGEVNIEIEQLREAAGQRGEATDVQAQEQMFERIDALKKQRNEYLEAILMELVPEAFAVVKETCRRFAQQGGLRVQATGRDQDYLRRYAHKSFQNVVIEGDTAIWKNQWEVSGHVTEWNMVHYDVQLIGGVVLHKGQIAEMATGEGKTLVATLPAYLNGLAGEGVHIVTVNPYLARRDMEWNGPIFEFHGLTIACVDDTEPNSDERRQAYHADITYGTNNEFGFDYLRDNMAMHPSHLVQRDHHFAIVDEIDSVLIDEARTPLIISGPVPQGDKHEFNELKPVIERLIRSQRSLVNDELNKGKPLIQQGKEKEGAVHIYRAHRGMPKYKPLIKFLSEEGNALLMQKAEAVYLADNAKRLPEIDDELYFTIDEKNNQIELTDKGRDLITPEDDPNLFLMPDLAAELSELEADESLDKDEKIAKREALSRDYSEKSDRLHSIQQLLKAYTLFEKDVEYIVQDGKVMIVDENTGRVMPGRRYSDGLHQAIEAKENVKVEAATQTYATVTLQNFFRMYHKLAGMTGTAETEANEFHEIYELEVVVIPTNRPVIRNDYEDRIYKTKREKFNAIVEEIEALINAGQPILVGTSSVETSEQLSRFLKRKQIRHNVLNAKHHAREAEIVTEAGQAPYDEAAGHRIGNVTIATNMAGRGTDIKLGEGVREAGGLAIIGSERHESRRIDLQLRGRAGRQGDPGSSIFYVSLEDNLMRLFGSERIAKVMNMMKVPEGEVIQHKMISRNIANAQKKVEENNFSIRKRLLEFDDVMNKQREVIYARRANALFGDRLPVDLDHMLNDMATILAEGYAGSEEDGALRLELARYFAIDLEIAPDQLTELSPEELSQEIYQRAKAFYETKSQRLNQAVYEDLLAMRERQPAKQRETFEQTFLELDMTDGVRRLRFATPIGEVLASEGQSLSREFEKAVSLNLIDDRWKDHLRRMDELKQSVQTAVFEQKDPLLIYKKEAFNLFMSMIEDMNKEILSLLFRADLLGEEQAQADRREQRPANNKLKARHQDPNQEKSAGQVAGEQAGDGERKLSRAERRELERREKKAKKKGKAKV